MGKENFSKIKLLKLWEILSRESDEEHPLTTGELIARLEKCGISCDRRTLYRDIAALCEFGYEVITRRGQHSNSYYVVDRGFDVPELRVLIDAVQAASFVTEKKTAELVDKIAALGGSNRAEILKRNIVEFNTTKHSKSISITISTPSRTGCSREGRCLSSTLTSMRRGSGGCARTAGAISSIPSRWCSQATITISSAITTNTKTPQIIA